MSASEELMSAFRVFYAETVRPDVERIVEASAERLRGEMGAGLTGVRDELQSRLTATRDELRADMNGHFDAVHHRLGHLETEHRMLVVGVRRLEAARSGGGAE